MFETPNDTLMLVYLFVMGACLGSFGNVVIYRMPLGKSVVRPGSACGSCQKPIRFYDNIPILSWFILRGRCRNCSASYSVRYAMVELLTAVLFALAWQRFGWSWTLLEALVFIFSLVVVSFIDLDHMILPDKFTLSGILIGLAGAAVNPERPFMDSLYGVLLGGGFLWAIAYLYFVLRKREGMGGGDIKLLAWIGAVLGWQSVPFVIMVASIFGSIAGIATVLIKNRMRPGLESEMADGPDVSDVPTFAIPFGPFLASAALLYLLADGPGWIQWYLDMHGL